MSVFLSEDVSTSASSNMMISGDSLSEDTAEDDWDPILPYEPQICRRITSYKRNSRCNSGAGGETTRFDCESLDGCLPELATSSASSLLSCPSDDSDQGDERDHLWPLSCSQKVCRFQRVAAGILSYMHEGCRRSKFPYKCLADSPPTLHALPPHPVAAASFKPQPVAVSSFCSDNSIWDVD